MILPDCELRDMQDPGLLEFMDFVSLILNDGRYECRVVSSVPNWPANEGEFVFYSAGNVRTLSAYINGQWCDIQYTTSGQIIIDIGTGNDMIGGNDSDGFWVGSSAFDTAPFRVNLSGDLVAESATITGAIYASSGTIGGFTISPNRLTAGAGFNSVGLMPGSYPFYAGHTTASVAPFRVDVAGRVVCTSIEISNGIISASEITGNIVQTSANPASSRVKMYGGGLLGFDATLGLTFKIPTDGTAPIFANGIIQSATIIDTEIISNEFYTSSEYPRIELTDSGLSYAESAGGTLYGSGALYGDGTKYGAGVAFYVGNSSKPVVSIELERTLADIRLYNRNSVPAGAGVIGDLCVVNGELNLCTGAGTPGTYTPMGNMSFPASTAQGDLVYLSAAVTLARLAKDTTATRYLSNTGGSNNPAWAQIDLTNGVTGTLPLTNGGIGATSLAAAGIAALGANTDITSLGGIATAHGSGAIFNLVAYTGDGNDNRIVAHGLGRSPVMAWVQGITAQIDVIWMSGFVAGQSKDGNSNIITDGIKSVDATNVTLGTTNSVNQSTKGYVLYIM